MPPCNRDLCLHPLEPGIQQQGVTLGALNPQSKTPPTHIPPPAYEMNELNKFPTVGMLMDGSSQSSSSSRPPVEFGYESVSGGGVDSSAHVSDQGTTLGGQDSQSPKSSCVTQRVVSSNNNNIRFPLEVGEIVFTASTHENHHTVRHI